MSYFPFIWLSLLSCFVLFFCCATKKPKKKNSVVVPTTTSNIKHSHTLLRESPPTSSSWFPEVVVPHAGLGSASQMCGEVNVGSLPFRFCGIFFFPYEILVLR